MIWWSVRAKNDELTLRLSSLAQVRHEQVRRLSSERDLSEAHSLTLGSSPSHRSQEGSQFCKGFGGIGGILRYKVDFAQIADAIDDVRSSALPCFLFPCPRLTFSRIVSSTRTSLCLTMKRIDGVMSSLPTSRKEGGARGICRRASRWQWWRMMGRDGERIETTDSALATAWTTGWGGSSPSVRS
jgi:hypothetical protein